MSSAVRLQDGSGTRDPGSGRRTGSHRRRWTAMAAVEVAAATAAVALDLGVPTFVLLLLAAVSLAIRREGLSTLGFHHVAHGGRLAGKMLLFAAAWSVLQLGVTMPIANHLSGEQTDFGDFAGIQGDVAMLGGLLLLSWTLAAVGEELAYRGYFQTRIVELFGSRRVGIVVAVLATSLLFGLAHSEQGMVGAAVIALDAVAFSVLRYHYRSLWASVLAHGFNNTIGFVAFFLVGPVHGFW